MKKIDDLRYEAEDGFTFVEKKTGKRFGNGIYLGSSTIEDFEEQPMTQEELDSLKENKRH